MGFSIDKTPPPWRSQLSAIKLSTDERDESSEAIAEFFARLEAAGASATDQAADKLPDALKRFAALAAAVLMVMIGAFAWMQWREADHAKSLAQRERGAEIKYRMMESDRAAIELARMQRNESRYLADLGRQYQLRGDAGTALLLALEGLPDGASSKLGVAERSTVVVDGDTGGI
jgi:hypothetical protein